VTLGHSSEGEREACMSAGAAGDRVFEGMVRQCALRGMLAAVYRVGRRGHERGGVTQKWRRSPSRTEQQVQLHGGALPDLQHVIDDALLHVRAHKLGQRACTGAHMCR
jgi:hypothetical protein